MKRILLIEDHADTAEVLARVLRGAGHEVRAVRTAAAARRAAEEEAFDVALLDIGLPDGSGIDLFRELRGRRPGLVGIAVSGFAMEKDVQACLDAGFAEHITKPVVLPRILQAIDRN